jgi:hypothetical protein
MGVSLKMMPKKNNLASPPETKYYPCALHNGEVNLNQLAVIVASPQSGARLRRIPTNFCKINKAFSTRLF